MRVLQLRVHDALEATTSMQRDSSDHLLLRSRIVIFGDVLESYVTTSDAHLRAIGGRHGHVWEALYARDKNTVGSAIDCVTLSSPERIAVQLRHALRGMRGAGELHR